MSDITIDSRYPKPDESTLESFGGSVDAWKKYQILAEYGVRRFAQLYPVPEQQGNEEEDFRRELRAEFEASDDGHRDDVIRAAINPDLQEELRPVFDDMKPAPEETHAYLQGLRALRNYESPREYDAHLPPHLRVADDALLPLDIIKEPVLTPERARVQHEIAQDEVRRIA